MWEKLWRGVGCMGLGDGEVWLSSRLVTELGYRRGCRAEKSVQQRRCVGDMVARKGMGVFFFEG